MSLVEGTWLGLQLESTLHQPPLVLVQFITAAWADWVATNNAALSQLQITIDFVISSFIGRLQMRIPSHGLSESTPPLQNPQ